MEESNIPVVTMELILSTFSKKAEEKILKML